MMNGYQLTPAQIAAYREDLTARERAPGTVEKYTRDVESFRRWLDGRDVTAETAAALPSVLQFYLENDLEPVPVSVNIAGIAKG